MRQELIVKKSRFIASLVPIENSEHANDELRSLKKEFWDARHNPHALVTGLLGESARSSDDGEPAGTAGMPMLEVLKKQELSDVLVVVTRYFGGVKLGAGGLIRAYGSAVSLACEHAQRKARKSLRAVSFNAPLAEVGRWQNLLRDWLSHNDGLSGSIHYDHQARLELLVPEHKIADLQQKLAEINSAELVVTIGENRIVETTD